MDEGAVALGEVADLGERGDIAVHREDAVGRDQLEARAGGVGRLELRLEIGHVGIPVAVALGLAEADAVDDRGVVELVGDHRVLGAEQRLVEAAIGVEAGGIEDGVLHPEPFRELVLQRLVDRLRAADEADRGHSVAPALEPRLCGGLDPLVLGEAKIIVGAEVDHVLARGDLDMAALRSRDHPLGLVEAGLADAVELGLEMLLEFAVHSFLQDRHCERSEAIQTATTL